MTRKSTQYFIQVVLILVVVSCSVNAQSESHAQETAPPPLKIISRGEREQIDQEKEAKDRVKLTIELAESHLANAELKTTQHEYDGAAAECGKYWALLEDVFVFMKKMKTDTNKTRDLYKRIELTLRAHGPRLSVIRRSTPVQHAVWIKQLEDYARAGRTEALNSFYGHTVVREQKSSAETTPGKPNERRTTREGGSKNP